MLVIVIIIIVIIIYIIVIIIYIVVIIIYIIVIIIIVTTLMVSSLNIFERVALSSDNTNWALKRKTVLFYYAFFSKKHSLLSEPTHPT